MINKRKVRLMARTAMYEKHEGTTDIPKAKYYKKDYVGLQMWKTAIAVTLAYVLILGLAAAYNFEYIVYHLTKMNYTVVIIIGITLYVAMETIFLLIAYFVYSIRYDDAEYGIKIYTSRLQKIFLMNKADKKQKNKGGASE